MANMEATREDLSLNLKATELCLGLPGGGGGGEGAEVLKNFGKRSYSETIDLKLNLTSNESESDVTEKSKNSPKDKKLVPVTNDPAKPPAAKAQVVGWPPVRSFRKNNLAVQKSSNDKDEKTSPGAAFVKVSLDGAPYLRKVDLKMYKSYQELSDALGKMFSSFTIGSSGCQGMKDFMNENKLMDLLNGSEFMPTYEDKDGDWMLVGDVPWEMFVNSCKRLRIMKGSDAVGLDLNYIKFRTTEDYQTVFEKLNNKHQELWRNARTEVDRSILSTTACSSDLEILGKPIDGESVHEMD